MAARGNYEEGIMEYDTTLLHNITKFPDPFPDTRGYV